VEKAREKREVEVAPLVLTGLFPAGSQFNEINLYTNNNFNMDRWIDGPYPEHRGSSFGMDGPCSTGAEVLTRVGEKRNFIGPTQ
jgi:hypothetical protein